MNAARGDASVAWGRVGLFVLIAVGGGWVVGLGLWRLLGVVPVGVVRALTALLYMPLPLVAALVVERVAGRRPLAVRAWRHLRADWRRLLAILAAGALPVVVVVGLALAASVAAAALGLPGAGTLITTSDQLAEALGALLGTPLPAGTALPPPAVLVAITLVQGLVAGATLNALVAFGEEYGWRGVLAEELAPLGRWRAHTLIGVIWGLWHAPLIVWLGLNFGGDWARGVPAMVVFCVVVGFVLAWSAERAGVFAAAVGHGVLNGTVGVVFYLVTDASPFVVPPGLILWIAAAGVAVALWARRGRTPGASEPLSEGSGRSGQSARP